MMENYHYMDICSIFYNNVNSVDKRSPFVGLYETLFLEQKRICKKLYS